MLNRIVQAAQPSAMTRNAMPFSSDMPNQPSWVRTTTITSATMPPM